MQRQTSRRGSLVASASEQVAWQDERQGRPGARRRGRRRPEQQLSSRHRHLLPPLSIPATLREHVLAPPLDPRQPPSPHPSKACPPSLPSSCGQSSRPASSPSGTSSVPRSPLPPPGALLTLQSLLTPAAARSDPRRRLSTRAAGAARATRSSSSPTTLRASTRSSATGSVRAALPPSCSTGPRADGSPLFTPPSQSTRSWPTKSPSSTPSPKCVRRLRPRPSAAQLLTELRPPYCRALPSRDALQKTLTGAQFDAQGGKVKPNA